MRIAVIGPGAMGILLSSRLFDSGADVTLIDRDRDRAVSLASIGVTLAEISGETKTRRIPVATAESAGGDFDLAVITVKAAQTQGAAKAAAALLAPGGAALTLQNGVGGADVLARVLGPGRVLVGVTAQGATLLERGRARHGGEGPTVVGPFDPGGSGRPEVVELFVRAGLETRWESDVRPFVWRKLAVNCGINAITALTGAKNAIVRSSPDAASVCRAAVREVLSVAGALGVDLGGAEELATHVLSVAERTGLNRSSMGQDVDRRRATEIEFINGAVVRFADDLGIPVPVNETLARLVRALESTFPRS